MRGGDDAWIRSGAAVLGAAVALLGGSAVAGGDTRAVVRELSALRTRHAADPGRAQLPARFVQEITSWQPTPLSLVVSGDPGPEIPEHFPLTHPVFAFQWTEPAEGRQLVVDAGLARSRAGDFGAPMEWLGADPMRCNPRAWDRLRDAEPGAGARPGAVVFTHLHVDHTTGVRELCRGGRTVAIRLSPEQDASDERFERAGREDLEVLERQGCVRREPWRVTSARGGVEALEGFAGVYRVAVPGHTPGSQLVVGFVAEAGGRLSSVVIAGDVANHRAGLRLDLPKPWWYRWLIVREDEDAQRRHRALLWALDSEGFEVVVNHHLPDATRELVAGSCP